MKKRVIAAIIAMGLGTFAVAGCGSADTTAKDTQAEESTGAETETTEESAEEPADEAADSTEKAEETSSDEEITITYMQWQQEFSTSAIKLADAYMEEHPNVKVEVITNSDGYSENLKAALTAGNVPEIFMSEGYENMKGYLEYITDLSDQDWTADIKDAAKQCVTLDGKVLGMPVTMAGEGIVYNKAMFEEHGWEVPETFPELEALCEQIEAEGITPFNNEFADDWLLGQLISACGYAYIPEGETFTQALYAGEETLADNEQMQNAFKVLDLMLKYGQDDCMSYGWNETCTAFATGEAAMAFEGDWIWDTISAIDPEIECGIFAVPATDNADDTKMIVDANGCFHIGKGSAHPEAGIEYLNWIATSETARQIMLEDYKIIPVFEGWEYQADNKLAESSIEYLDAGKNFLWSWPQWPAGFQYAAGKTWQRYIGEEITADEALQEMDATWTKLVNNPEA